MRVRHIAAGAVFGLALTVPAACGEDDESPTGPTDAPVTFSMNEFDGNGVSGSATITDQPGETSTVLVELSGLPPGGQHAGHVHQGSCTVQGAILFGLLPISGDVNGDGSATTTGVPDNLLVDGFYLQYHVELDPPGDPIACANIPLATNGAESPDPGIDPGFDY